MAKQAQALLPRHHDLSPAPCVTQQTIQRRGYGIADNFVRCNGWLLRCGRASHGQKRQREQTIPQRYHSCFQALRRSVFFIGKWRMRRPVAAAMALSTAGAATAMVGSPTPPQNVPSGIRMLSTFGISSMRMAG
jgi:hypothetical protein